MAALLAIGYADQSVAEDARRSIQQLEDELATQVDHVASISRDVEGRYHAHISQSAASAGGGVDWGRFWWALFGSLFCTPAAGLAFGADPAALRARLGEQWIDERFRDQVRQQVKPGTSAVFMVTEQATSDKAVGALARFGGTLIMTSLSNAKLKGLRELLRSPTYTDVST
jgi:uncharacterized membrane protein